MVTVEFMNDVQFVIETNGLNKNGNLEVVALIIMFEFNIEMHPPTYIVGILPLFIIN